MKSQRPTRRDCALNHTANNSAAPPLDPLGKLVHTRGHSERIARIEAGVADAVDRAEAAEVDLPCSVLGLDGFVAQQIGAEVLLVGVAEDRHDHGVVSEFVLHGERGEEVGAARDADAEPQVGRELLRHEDRVTVVDSDDAIEFGEMHDGRDELVADTLDAMPQIAAAEHEEVMALVEGRQLAGTGIGWTDAHLMAAALIARVDLWTLDRALGDAWKRIGAR